MRTLHIPKKIKAKQRLRMKEKLHEAILQRDIATNKLQRDRTTKEALAACNILQQYVTSLGATSNVYDSMTT